MGASRPANTLPELLRDNHPGPAKLPAHGKAAADGERDRYEAVEDSLSGGATPLDYLEKIFQIPFWLSPMPVTARKNMVKGLLEQSLVKPTPTVQEGRLGAGVAPSTSGATPGSTTTRGDGAGAVTPTKQAAGQDASGDGAPGQASQHAREVKELRPPDLNPAALTIEQKELEFIEELTQLLGRSPRALKRFINVYRLVKASLRDAEPPTFLLNKGESGEYKTVMFLLALITNYPSIACMLLRAIEDEVSAAADQDGQADPGAETKSALHWEALRKRLEAANSGLGSDNDWKEVAKWLPGSQGQLLTDRQRLDYWVQRVARFSFITEPSWLS